MPSRSPTLLAAIGVALAAGPALAAGDATEGRRIAAQWCTSCHVTTAKGTGADAAPPFAVLASNPAKTEAYLKAWISNPHPPMPNFNLSRQTIDDLVAYIRSLDTGAPKGVR